MLRNGHPMAREPTLSPRLRRRMTAAIARPSVVSRASRPRATWPYALGLLFATLAIIGAFAAFRLISQLPDTRELFSQSPSQDITLLDVHGRLIARRGLTRGRLVDVRTLPAYVPNAFIAIEDRRFREHLGLDPLGLVRAAAENFIAGHVVQGGSTLTEQLAKNLFLESRRTVDRKLEEALFALYLESHYSKDQILTLYLNRVYFGAGTWGIEAAAQRFFGKPARALSLVEAAMLAGSVKAPAHFNPLADETASLARAGVVLRAMEQCGFITPRQRIAAESDRPRIAPATATQGSGYFADWIIARLPEFVGETTQPLIIATTLDLDAQAEAERAVETALSGDGAVSRASESALISMTPEGAIRAMVGGRSYAQTPFNRVTDASRQPGSAFKPFVYLAAFERGHKPDEVVNDGPVDIRGWRPANYEGRYEGPITLARAFAKSSNSIAAQLTEDVGALAVANAAHRLGIASRLDAVPSLALGASDVTLLELTGAYAPFANGGARVQPYGIISIRTKSGRALYRRYVPGEEQVVTPENAAAIVELMVDVSTNGTGRAAQLDARAVAGKTGTTQGYRDAWFVGFTSDLICGVWVGNDDDSAMRHVTGGTIPARVFHTFMQAAERGRPPQPLISLRNMGAPVSAQASPAAQPDAFQKLLDSLFNRT
jgi:penicillin-binding protein 1A